MQGRRIDRAEQYVRSNTPMSGSTTVHSAFVSLQENKFYLTTEDEVRWAFIRSSNWVRVESNTYRRVN
jgi:hypothetical protein